MDENKIVVASRLLRDREVSIAEVCGAFGVLRSALYRYPNPDGQRRNGSGTSSEELG